MHVLVSLTDYLWINSLHNRASGWEPDERSIMLAIQQNRFEADDAFVDAEDFKGDIGVEDSISEEQYFQQQQLQLARKQLEDLDPNQSLRNPKRLSLVLHGGTSDSDSGFDGNDQLDEEEQKMEDLKKFKGVPKCIEGSGSGSNFADEVYILNLDR